MVDLNVVFSTPVCTDDVVRAARCISMSFADCTQTNIVSRSSKPTAPFLNMPPTPSYTSISTPRPFSHATSVQRLSITIPTTLSPLIETSNRSIRDVVASMHEPRITLVEPPKNVDACATFGLGVVATGDVGHPTAYIHHQIAKATAEAILHDNNAPPKAHTHENYYSHHRQAARALGGTRH